MQKYKIFKLFILILNYSLCGCVADHAGPAEPKHENQSEQNMKAIEVGDKAPLFTLPDQNGKMFNLDDHLGRKTLVIFFYPKDESYGCTKEACSFRDNYEVFKEAGAEVIGISADNESSHKSFAANHKLPFILLADKARFVAEKYGIGRTMGIIPSRVTFVIDKDGIVRMKFSSQFNFQKHILEAIETIKKL